MAGVHELTRLSLEEISVCDVPANKFARVVLLKNRDGATSQGGENMANEIERLAKALAESGCDAELVSKQIRLGVVSPSSLAAEIALTAKAAEIRKREPGLTDAQAYLRATKENPALFAKALDR